MDDDRPGSPPLSAVYLDFQSAACARVWRWLSAAGVRHGVEVRPFWMESRLSAAGGGGPWERARPTSGLELLALGEFARERGHERHLALIDAAFALLGDEADESSGLETWLALGARAGLDLNAFTAESERWRAEVGLWHAEARDELGVDGVPALVLAERHAVRVELAREVTDAAEAATLLERLGGLATGPLKELRRTSG